MKPYWMTLLLLALPLAAQEKKAEPGPAVQQKLFILKYANPDYLPPLLRVLGANAEPKAELHALAVRATPETMPAIEEAIQRLDVPSAAPQDLELTVYYVIAGQQENPGAGVAPLPPVPKDLDNVVAQLKNAFPFKSYRLLEALTLRTRSGQLAETSGNPYGTNVTQFQINSATVSQDGSTVRIDRLKAGVHRAVPGAGQPPAITYVDLGLNTDVDIKEGQKIVVGRLGMGQDQALFLVLTARVVN